MCAIFSTHWPHFFTFLSQRDRRSFISLSEWTLGITPSNRLAFELPSLFGDEFSSEFAGERPERNHGYRD